MAAMAMASRNGMLGPAGINLFSNANPTPTKARHNSMDKGSANRSRLLEDFRYKKLNSGHDLVTYTLERGCCMKLIKYSEHPNTGRLRTIKI